MKFGYFDDQNKEYVITTPQTPLPWINYLGSEDFFSLVSNTAGGQRCILLACGRVYSIENNGIMRKTRIYQVPLISAYRHVADGVSKYYKPEEYTNRCDTRENL